MPPLLSWPSALALINSAARVAFSPSLPPTLAAFPPGWGMGTAEYGARAEDGGHAPYSAAARSLRISLLRQKRTQSRIRAWGSVVLPQYKASRVGRRRGVGGWEGAARPDLVTHR